MASAPVVHKNTAPKIQKPPGYLTSRLMHRQDLKPSALQAILNQVYKTNDADESKPDEHDGAKCSADYPTSELLKDK